MFSAGRVEKKSQTILENNESNNINLKFSMDIF